MTAKIHPFRPRRPLPPLPGAYEPPPCDVEDYEREAFPPEESGSPIARLLTWMLIFAVCVVWTAWWLGFLVGSLWG